MGSPRQSLRARVGSGLSHVSVAAVATTSATVLCAVTGVSWETEEGTDRSHGGKEGQRGWGGRRNRHREKEKQEKKKAGRERDRDRKRKGEMSRARMGR